MPYVSHLFFRTAIVFLVIGIAVGLHMAISGDHSVAPAHAHINLLGWVTSALFGAYYALNPAKAQRRIAMIQYGVYTVGIAIMLPALYVLLSGYPEIEPVVAGSALVVYAGVILFAVILFARRESKQALRPAEPAV